MKKDVNKMTVDELIEYRRSYKMSDEELEDQRIAIAVAEARHSGDTSATIETMRAVVHVAKHCERQRVNKGNW